MNVYKARAARGEGVPASESRGAGEGSPRLNEDLIDFAEINEIELRVLRRMKEYTLGDHGSVFHGTGVDFVGLRDWQAGDRLSSIDWPQSSLTNFTPLIVRDYEQPGTAPIVVVADRSASTRCGVNGVPIAAGVARATATIGLSAVYFQDMFGLVGFDQNFSTLGGHPPARGSRARHSLPRRVSGPRRHG